MGINKCLISGNLTRDINIRSTAGGMSVGNITVAVNDRKKNPSSGEWEDVANYVDCTIFGTRAEKLQPYLVKGCKVAIEGKLHYSQWEKDGVKHSKLDVTVDDIELMSKAEHAAVQPMSTRLSASADAYSDEDLPF